ncbi:hypothetical protein [Paenibacillus sp. YIM B09110]|uniref:hypothetical protein n=1 Tax=Paenibacillus sp. YIM B09110 TaxID=3126102 RepID=UPI00301CAC6C
MDAKGLLKRDNFRIGKPFWALPGGWHKTKVLSIWMSIIVAGEGERMSNRYPYYNPYRPGKPRGYRQLNGHALASMILGICSIVFWWTWLLSIVCGIIGLLLGFKGIDSQRPGLARVGIFTSLTGLGIGAISLLFKVISWL